jgi:hypothetical protein
MNNQGLYQTWWALAVLALCLVMPAPVGAADSLTWNKETGRVDAQIETWNLVRLLEEISETTGWTVYVEPGASAAISSKFKNVSSGDALTKLLGSLNYALLPQPDGTEKLFVFRNSRDSATKQVQARSKTKAKPIPNELILTLKPGAGESIEDLAKRLGAKIIGRSDDLNSYRLQFPDEASANAAREALSGNTDLAMVDSNYNVYRPVQPESLAAEGLSPINLKATGTPDSTKLIIGLVDTPVQGSATPYSEFLLPSQSVAGDYKPENSSPTHGTSMLETILRGLSQAPQPADGTPIRVLPVDVYGAGATTSTFDVAKGIIAAINGGSSIINLSLGSDGDSQVLHTAVKQAYERGILVVAAAGNESSASATYPAAYSEVLAVTAGKNGTIASYANYGNFVDLVAPGSNVIYFNGRTYLTAGTSVSTAYISGLASGLSVKNGVKPQQVGSMLMNTFGRTGK